MNKEIGRKQCEGMARAMNIIRSHMDELPNGITEVSKEQLDQVPVAAPEFLQECKATAEKYEKGKRMNNDLISRKAVDEIIGKEIDCSTSYDAHETQINIKFAVKDLPTAYNAEKVIEQLEELRDRFTVEDYHIRGIIEKAIEIVRKGGVE